MTFSHTIRIVALVCLLLVLPSSGLISCPVCFGETESGSEVGLNAAVWVMVGVTTTVLSLFSALFMRFRRRMRMKIDAPLEQPAKN